RLEAASTLASVSAIRIQIRLRRPQTRILLLPIMFKRLPSVFFAIPLLVLLLPLVADASRLEWDQTEARIEMKPGQEQARAEYIVTNKGDETVRIARVKTSCGCTGSLLDNKIIKPGESATITGTFNKGKRQGLNHNKLEVFLDNQPEAVATLHMIVQVPKLVDAQPQIVYWNADTSKTDRQVRITLDKRYVSEISEIEYDQSKLIILEETDPTGKADRILRILPQSFDKLIRETVIITGRGKDGMKADARLHVFVQP
ncbi:DUF1573 domain-containing protein, partial [Lentimonas sp. CC19]|uniref:DUF1573 domain-containing protein n=2 Tax=Lentimonas TaxID=417293 RepID=UPI001A7ED20F